MIECSRGIHSFDQSKVDVALEYGVDTSELTAEKKKEKKNKTKEMVKEYLKCMGKSGTFAGEVELTVLPSILKRPIVVMQLGADGSLWKHYTYGDDLKGGDMLEAIAVLYHGEEAKHYSLLSRYAFTVAAAEAVDGENMECGGAGHGGRSGGGKKRSGDPCATPSGSQKPRLSRAQQEQRRLEKLSRSNDAQGSMYKGKTAIPMGAVSGREAHGNAQRRCDGRKAPVNNRRNKGWRSKRNMPNNIEEEGDDGPMDHDMEDDPPPTASPRTPPCLPVPNCSSVVTQFWYMCPLIVSYYCIPVCC
jgi:hypothetical protein